MAHSDEKFCPLCAKEDEQNKLVLHKINVTDGFYLCSRKDVSQKSLHCGDAFNRILFPVVCVSDGRHSVT